MATFPAPGNRYWLLLASSILALGCAYAALVFASANWHDTQALNCIYPDEGMRIQSFSAAAWRRCQQLTGGAAVLATGGWFWLGPGTAAGRRELGALGAALRQVAKHICQTWRGLTPWQRHFFLLHLAGLTVVRLYLSWTLLWHDDAASFALFVRHGLLAVAAYYPVPNNHLLISLMALGLKQLHPGFWWSMRLPVLLTSTAGTSLLFGAVVRRLGYWPALLAAAASSWLHPSLYYAANGRGYWAVILLTGAVFWALLALLDEGQRDYTARVAWLVLVGAGILGCYAVPAFAYVVASAWSWLGIQAAWRRQGQLGWQVLGSGLLVAVGVGLLYAPLLYVSGLAALIGNPYVQRLPAAAFWRALPAYLWFTESYLGGQYHLGALLLLLELSIGGWLAWQMRRGRLTAEQRQRCRVGGPALWFVVVPYGLMLGQQVLAPERVLLYKAWFGFLLLALGGAAWRWTRPQRWLLGLAVATVGLYQVTSLLGDNRRHWLLITQHRRPYNWLAAHAQVFFPPGRLEPPCPAAPATPPGPPAHKH